MANAVKYSTTGDTQSLKKGNIYLGVGDVGKGPSSATTYYNGVTPATSGYTVYTYNASQTSKISYNSPSNDTQLISYTNGLSGQNFTGSTQCLNWYLGQSNYACVNRDYEPIVTSGLTLCVDAGFTPSYTSSGTTWYDVSYGGNNGTLTNGPTFSSANGGSIVFDGVDDRVSQSTSINTGQNFTVNAWIYPTSLGTTRRAIASSSYNYSSANGWFFCTAGAGVNNTFFFSIGADNAYRVAAADTLSPNQWVYVSVVCQNGGGSIDLYKNGTVITSYAVSSLNSNTMTYTYNQFNIGWRDVGGGADPYTGNISIVQIYNRALSSTEILQNYNAQKTRYVASFDPDAQAFITAAGITNSTQQNAINQLVLDLKSYNIWASMIAIYPFVGGTANTNKYNLKNTSTYTLSFGGGWTHSSTGSLPNGTNGYADTGINPNTDLGSNHNYSVYSRTDNTSYGNTIGTYELGNGSCGENGFVAELQLYLRNGNVLLVRDQPNGNYGGISNTSTLGYFTINRTSTLTAYKNGSSIGSFSAALSLPYNTISLSAAHIYDSDCGTTYYDEYDNRELAFATFANSSLTSTNISNLNTAVQAFQTTLGRQV